MGINAAGLVRPLLLEITLGRLESGIFKHQTALVEAPENNCIWTVSQGDFCARYFGSLFEPHRH